MNYRGGILTASVFLALFSACSSAPTTPAATVPAVAKSGSLTGLNGETLYVYKKDAVANKSSCVRDCLKIFRPLFAAPDDVASGSYTVFERPDGMSQWAYKGKALYLCPVVNLPKGAPAPQVKAAEKQAAACTEALKSDWEVAKP